jgi:hypothetical protein
LVDLADRLRKLATAGYVAAFVAAVVRDISRTGMSGGGKGFRKRFDQRHFPNFETFSREGETWRCWHVQMQAAIG